MLRKTVFLLFAWLIPFMVSAQVNPDAWADLDFKKEDAKKLKQTCFPELKSGVLIDSIANREIGRVDRCGVHVIFSTLKENTQNLFFGETIYLQWFVNPVITIKPSQYALEITNLDGDSYFKTVQKDSSFLLRLQAQEFRTLPELFIITITPLEKEGKILEVSRCENWACRRVTEESQRQIQQAINLIEQEAKSSDEPTKLYLKARFFAKYQLRIDAITYLQQAVRLAKGAQKATLKKLYQIVLKKM
jgi:hypothetical protein